jgi:hypothetical protein
MTIRYGVSWLRAVLRTCRGTVKVRENAREYFYWVSVRRR